MGCICSTSRSQGSPERAQPIRADGQSSSNANLSALASLLNATHTLHHQLEADRSSVAGALSPLRHEADQLREEIAGRIQSGFWNSPPNALQDRLNTIRRDFNAIIAIDAGQELHYSGEFPMPLSPSRRALGQSVISAPGSPPDTP